MFSFIDHVPSMYLGAEKTIFSIISNSQHEDEGCELLRHKTKDLVITSSLAAKYRGAITA